MKQEQKIIIDEPTCIEKEYRKFQKDNMDKDTYLCFNDWYMEIYKPNRNEYMKKYGLL